MYNEQIEVIKEVDFKEIQDKAPFSFKARPFLKDEPKTGQEEEQEQIKEVEQKSIEALFEKRKDSLKDAQELSEKIKRTSICIKLVRDQGCTRAHVTHRLTHQLLAVIPWYSTERGNPAQQAQVNEYFSSFYANMSMGAKVDRQI